MERSMSRMSTWIGFNTYRLWWALLIVIHIPILANVGRTLVLGSESGIWLAFFALILTVLFFVLKLIDVRFLRIRSHRNGVMVFIVACLFMHHEVMASEVTHEVLQQAPMIMVIGAVVAGARITRKQFRNLLHDLNSAFAQQLVFTHLQGTVVTESPPIARWFNISRLAIPRAPPF